MLVIFRGKMDTYFENDNFCNVLNIRVDMNREIKFRGKRKDNGEWIYGYLCEFEGSLYVIPKSYFGTNYFGEAHYKVDRELKKGIAIGEWFAITQETVGDFTGLLDKSGKEIYDGDIIKTDNRLTMITWTGNGFNGVYMNDNGTWDDQWEDQISRSYKIDLLGNIHDNPELLR
jgi:uncharacterized phage protein (TIGR01671 family)